MGNTREKDHHVKNARITSDVFSHVPPGLSIHDARLLKKVEHRAYQLDMGLFKLCGVRFGWSSVIGIIPGIGDVIDTLLSFMVLRMCQQVEGGLPLSVKMKMYTNIVVDLGVGLVPVLGDIADVLFRANTRNAAVFNEYLQMKCVKAQQDIQRTGNVLRRQEQACDLAQKEKAGWFSRSGSKNKQLDVEHGTVA